MHCEDKPNKWPQHYHLDKRRASSVHGLYLLVLQEQNFQNAFITATGTRALALLMMFIVRCSLFITLSRRMCNESCETVHCAGGIT